MGKAPALSNVKSAARFGDILEHVAAQPVPPRFSEILTALALPKSSLFNLVGTMVARGYLEADEITGGYRLGPAIARLAAQVGATPTHTGRVQGAVRRLADVLNETVSYYERRDDEAEVMCTDAGRQAFGYTLQTGDRAPLYCISAGKALLAHLDDEAVEAYLDRTKLIRFTGRTLHTRKAVRGEIATVRETGFAYSREEYSLGIVGIAVPVTIGKRVVGALGIALPAVRYNDEIDGRMRRALCQSASAIERQS